MARIAVVLTGLMLGAAGSVPALGAERGAGLSFAHHDWQLACDNTRTCRAAGYQSEDGVDQEAQPVSVMLTRRAGPDEAVTAELALGVYDDESPAGRLPKGAHLLMKIDGQSVGEVVLDGEGGHAQLSAAQVAALLKALTGTSRIVWQTKGTHWELSGKGASAVLLKMDDFQGRVGTPGALVRKGNKPEGSVLPPLTAPVVTAAPVAPAQPGDEAMARTPPKALLEQLRASLKSEDCPDQEVEGGEAAELTLERLSSARLLAGMRCWSGAYNVGYAYWVINATPPYQPALVTANGSDAAGGVISSAQKGRGLGDCWDSSSWTWDGTSFVLTEVTTTGMCRLIEPGGAWNLPTWVTRAGAK